jgi:hypothetical protein
MATYDPRIPFDSSATEYSDGTPYDGFSPAPGGGETTWTVLLAIDLSANGVGNWFTLDDATKGVLGNGTYKLAGESLVDITGWVRSLSIERGRSRVLEKFTSGSANLVLDNRERLFDPLMTSSPFYGAIVPRKQIVITKNDQPVYLGNVQDWDFSYDVSGNNTALPKAADGFAYLAQGNLAPGTATSQASGARVQSILTQAGWPTNQRSIATGLATLNADYIPPNTNTLSYLQKVELSESGSMFIAKDGNFTFKDGGSPSFSGVTFGPAGLPFVDYEVVYGVEEMKNKVNVTWTAGTAIGGTATAEDSTSQAAYGVFEVTYETVLNDSTAANAYATAQVTEYAQPKYRVDSITVVVDALTPAQELQVLALELGDAVLISWSPFGETISQYCVIDGIQHQATPATHFITYKLSQTTIA